MNDQLTDFEIVYVQKLTALLKELSEAKVTPDALRTAVDELIGSPRTYRLNQIKKAVMDEAIQHLTRTLN